MANTPLINVASFPEEAEKVLRDYFSSHHPNLQYKILKIDGGIQFIAGRNTLDLAFAVLKGFQIGFEEGSIVHNGS